MKIIYIVLLILLILPNAWAGDSISIDDFKKIKDPVEREKFIDQAPPEQRDELKKIDRHLRLVSSLGGEAALKVVKEKAVERARGLVMLENVFATQTELWDGYMGDFLNANYKSIATHGQSSAEWNELKQERSLIGNRLFNVVHPLVFNLAPSPQALALEKKAESLNQYMWDNFPPSDSTKHITKEQLTEVDKQMDQIFEEMQKLPKLTPEQAQKEYDEFPEEKIRTDDL
jgi:hypothetical protein